MKGKSPKQEVFDKIIPATLNGYFQEFMEDLTAKTWRTYNASYTLRLELDKFDMSKKNQYSQDDLVKFYNDANRQVAILCNHQKAASKGHEAQIEKMIGIKDKMEKEKKILSKHFAA